jgi:hypothetical protein
VARCFGSSGGRAWSPGVAQRPTGRASWRSSPRHPQPETPSTAATPGARCAPIAAPRHAPAAHPDRHPATPRDASVLHRSRSAPPPLSPPTARQKAGETDIFNLDGTDICTLGLHNRVRTPRSKRWCAGIRNPPARRSCANGAAPQCARPRDRVSATGLCSARGPERLCDSRAMKKNGYADRRPQTGARAKRGSALSCDSRPARSASSRRISRPRRGCRPSVFSSSLSWSRLTLAPGPVFGVSFCNQRRMRPGASQCGVNRGIRA